ncbi:MAG: DUF4031 domain-containing protein [Pseudomonadota bacterium]
MILVDTLMTYAYYGGQLRSWCHMATDNLQDDGLAELHEMAAKLGLERKHFQPDPRVPHYDLVVSKQAEVVKLGARLVTRRELLKRCERKRTRR